MHKISFGLKKAHLGAVAFAKGFLGMVPHMTPARYDLLYAIRMTDLTGAGWPFGYTCGQSELCSLLGLHPSTVSKAIKRLVEIGWLARNLMGRRGRGNTIHLTAKGLEAIELARRIVQKRKTVRYWFDREFRPGLRGWESAHNAIFAFWLPLESLADAFGRRAELIYPLPYILDD